MSAYDQRQYKLMLSRIDAYSERNIGLRTLIGRLDALIEVLQNADDTWKRQFRRYWAILEDAYAWSLYRGFKHLSPELEGAVNDAVRSMRELLFSRIE